MTWFAFQGGYDTIELAGVQEKQAVIMGFHGYGTKAEAEKHRNSVNSAQKATLNLLEYDYKQAVKQDSQPGGKNSNLADPNSILGIATGGLTNQDIQSWMIRIGEILLGIVLVGVGIAKLTGTTNAIAGLVKAKI